MRKSTNITGRTTVVANNNEAGIEKTGLDTVKIDERRKSKLFHLENIHFLEHQKLFLFVTSDAIAIFD